MLICSEIWEGPEVLPFFQTMAGAAEVRPTVEATRAVARENSFMVQSLCCCGSFRQLSYLASCVRRRKLSFSST